MEINNKAPRVVHMLMQLADALEQGRKNCEELVLTVPDAQLRKYLMGLRHQSANYAWELYEQIVSMGGSINPEFGVKTSGKPFGGKLGNVEKKLSSICLKIENTVIKLYGSFLRDHELNSGLRQMIQNQMNGIMGTTLHLKLVNRLLYTG
jgi:hypothetical protein